MKLLPSGAACALVLCSFPAEAARLDTVIVSATRAEGPLIAVPRSVVVIDRAAIETSSATHVVDVLRGEAGIQISDLYGDGSRATVDMRGFGGTASDTTLVLLNGRRLNNVDSGPPDLNSIKLDDVERIEVVQGSAGALYGDKAVGGVINIITRRPDRLRLHGALEGGSYGRRGLALAGGGRQGPVGWRVSAERRLADGFRRNNEQQYSNVSADLDFEHAGGRLFGEAGYVNENLGTPGALFRDQVQADRRQAQNPADFIDTDTSVLRFGIVQRLPLGFTLQAEYTNRGSHSESILSTFGARNDLRLKRHHMEVTPRLVGSLPWPLGAPAQVTIGADLFSTDYTLVSDIGTTIDEQEQQAVYAQVVLPLHPAVDLTLGTRHAEVQNDLFASTTFLGVSLPPGSELDGRGDATEIGLSWRPAAAWRLFARAERNFRFPNADEFSSIANFNAFPFPAPLPLPTTQVGRSYEGGVEWRGGRAEISALAWRLDVDAEIAFDPASGSNFNVGDSRRNGLTLGAGWSPWSRLHLSASYGWIDAWLTSGPWDGSDVTFVAEHVGRVGARLDLTAQAYASLEVAGTSGRVLAGDFANTLPALGGYAVGNLKFAWAHDGLTVEVRANNLLDRQYSDAGSAGFEFRDFSFAPVPTYFPAPERNFLLSIGYRYE